MHSFPSPQSLPPFSVWYVPARLQVESPPLWPSASGKPVPRQPSQCALLNHSVPPWHRMAWHLAHSRPAVWLSAPATVAATHRGTALGLSAVALAIRHRPTCIDRLTIGLPALLGHGAARPTIAFGSTVCPATVPTPCFSPFADATAIVAARPHPQLPSRSGRGPRSPSQFGCLDNCLRSSSCHRMVCLLIHSAVTRLNNSLNLAARPGPARPSRVRWFCCWSQRPTPAQPAPSVCLRLPTNWLNLGPHSSAVRHRYRWSYSATVCNA